MQNKWDWKFCYAAVKNIYCTMLHRMSHSILCSAAQHCVLYQYFTTNKWLLDPIDIGITLTNLLTKKNVHDVSCLR